MMLLTIYFLPPNLKRRLRECAKLMMSRWVSVFEWEGRWFFAIGLLVFPFIHMNVYIDKLIQISCASLRVVVIWCNPQEVKNKLGTKHRLTSWKWKSNGKTPISSFCMCSPFRRMNIIIHSENHIMSMRMKRCTFRFSIKNHLRGIVSFFHGSSDSFSLLSIKKP